VERVSNRELKKVKKKPRAPRIEEIEKMRKCIEISQADYRRAASS
jgi:hypothetical protein